jgi:hypothetical protein
MRLLMHLSHLVAVSRYHYSRLEGIAMRSLIRYSASLLFSAALSTSLFTAGCAVHAHVYDGYYGDNHRWDDHEVVYYNQWEHSTHRDHMEFEKRNQTDQKAYWRWRHNQH